MLSKTCTPNSGWIVHTLCTATLVLATSATAAERPSTMKLFPEETFVFIRTPNAHEFVEKLKETSSGRLARDPQLKPLVDKLYGEVGDLYTEKAQDKLGVSWDELQQLPHGEVALGIVGRSVSEPAFLMLVDQGDAPNVARRLLDKAIEEETKQWGEPTKETIEGVEVTVIRHGDNQTKMVGLFEKDNTVVFATDAEVLRQVLKHWNPEAAPAAATAAAAPAAETAAPDSAEASDKAPKKTFYSGRTLAENANFAAILRHCRRDQDPPPQLIFYADPIGFVRQVSRDNPGMQIAIATFPALGVDGILGVGATMAFSSGRYDDILHVHLLLQNPRAGVLQLISFEKGDTKPQPWVPASVETYMTGHWNSAAMYEKLIALVDKFQYPGASEKFVADKLSDPLGIDFPTQVIDNLAGRITYVSGFDKPARMTSQQFLVAIQLNDADFAQDTLDTVIAKYPDTFEKRKFGNVDYWAMTNKWLRDLPEEDRPFTPCVAIMDDQLILSRSVQLLERVFEARDGTADRLVDTKDYQRIIEVIGQETAGQTQVLLTVGRFEETLRHWYDLLTSEKTREQLEELSKGNSFFAALAEALAEHKLPPFEVLARYAAPSGGIVYDTDSGLHGINFTLRNEAQP